MQTTRQLKAAASRIHAFARASGGNPQYLSALELAAELAGFKDWRTAKAVLERTESSRQPMLFQQPVVLDWEASENEDGAAATKTRFELTLERLGPHQFALTMAPAGAGPSGYAGQPALSAWVEVNEGVPCFHLSNDPMGDQCLSVFGHQDGLLVRVDEAELVAGSRLQDFEGLRRAILRPGPSRCGSRLQVFEGLRQAAALDPAHLMGFVHPNGDADSPPVPGEAQALRKDVVEFLVEDVRTRMYAYGFTLDGPQNARDLAASSAELHQMEVSNDELDEACRRLMR